MGRCTTCGCNGNVDSALGPVCNTTTGQCLNCLNNTMGFECDQCIPGFYGDPGFGIPCRGNALEIALFPGSSPAVCHILYIKRVLYATQSWGGAWERGYLQICQKRTKYQMVHSITLLTLSIFPHLLLSRSTPTSFPFSPPSFLHFLYSNFPSLPPFLSLPACQCNPNGTVGDCDPVTGTCTCRPLVTGSRCEQCEDEFWGLSQGLGCIPCDCCNNGSISNVCNKVRRSCILAYIKVRPLAILLALESDYYTQ